MATSLFGVHAKILTVEQKHAKSGACEPKSTRVAAQQLHRIGQGVTSQAWHGQNAQELVVLRDRTEGNALFQTLVQRWHADPQGTNPATPRQAESAQVYEGNKFNPRTAIGSSGHARWVIPGGASASWADSDDIQMIARHRADAEDTNDEKHDVLLNASVKPILEPTTISQKGGERGKKSSSFVESTVTYPRKLQHTSEATLSCSCQRLLQTRALLA